MLGGKRFVVVEDEAIVAMLVEDFIVDLGGIVVATVARVADALALLDQTRPDAAVLDVNLAGQHSYPIADALGARAIPYLFVTGYGEAGLDAAYRDRPVLQKPFTCERFARALGQLAFSAAQ